MEQTVRLSQVLEIWESYSGWYWYVTEYHSKGICFGLVRGHEDEWGYFSIRELLRLRRSNRAWKVPRKHWALCPCVVNDAAHHQVKGG